MMRVREFLLNAATVVMVGCALLVAAVLVRRELLSPQTVAEVAGTRTERSWREYASLGHAVGPASAAVTIVEFGDYECTACRWMAPKIDSIRQKYPSDVRVVYRHMPLAQHRFAIPAARASECASEQDRFERMHSALYAYPDSFGIASWTWFAEVAGVADTARFGTCVRRRGPIGSILRDAADAKRLGVKGTPSFLVNDLFVGSGVPLDTLDAYVRRAMKPERGEVSGISVGGADSRR